jgi:hypothetical protein
VIDLVREVPEAMKPRRIEIKSTAPATIEASDAGQIEDVRRVA